MFNLLVLPALLTGRIGKFINCFLEICNNINITNVYCSLPIIFHWQAVRLGCFVKNKRAKFSLNLGGLASVEQKIGCIQCGGKTDP